MEWIILFIVTLNFKISLFDIIPLEMYENNKENNRIYILINGYINHNAKDTDRICPDYPSFMSVCLIATLTIFLLSFCAYF